MIASPVPLRAVHFPVPEPGALMWNRRYPEFACVANAVSLLMPHVEPYVVKSVRSAVGRLEGDEHEALRERAQAFVHQEIQHHVQHRRFNDVLVARYRGAAVLERWMRRTYTWLWKRPWPNFHLAFAAGFETVAFASARWTEKRLDSVMADVDPVPAGLFLWHFAEEVEHRDVAYEVYKAAHGTKRLYGLAMLVSLGILGWFTFLGTLLMLVKEHRWWRPVAYWRLLRWSVSFAFEAGPLMLVTMLRAHDPGDLEAPEWFGDWLGRFDPERTHAAEWDPLFTGR